MTEKIIIKNRWNGAVLYEYQPTEEEQSSGMAMRAALESAVRGDADLRGANLGGADLRGAYLRDADLGDAYLRNANLRGADLGGAYLRDADLRGADLRGANLGDGLNLIGDRPYFQIGPIGSRSDHLIAYLTDQGLRLSAGCFFGTLDEFLNKLGAEHGENTYAQEYRAAIELIRVHERLWMPEPIEQANQGEKE